MDAVFLCQPLKGKVLIPVTNTTIFAEVLDNYCRQQRLETRLYTLQRERNGRINKIDLSTSWGMSGLPSRAEIEVVLNKNELEQQGTLP
jgi:hypothetical protein